ncbi:hypothetical protein [uncultured Tateyamaria sp.]|uniref:hypothetical protein n=1 Tax=Tateyamaria sp. 1078 TaxID=3417464 RepID=UPI002626459D|nr:hypothetical protein [uncultured Tateyamaria sp.]
MTDIYTTLHHRAFHLRSRRASEAEWVDLLHDQAVTDSARAVRDFIEQRNRVVEQADRRGRKPLPRLVRIEENGQIYIQPEGFKP